MPDDNPSSILDDFDNRGLIHQSTDYKELSKRLDHSQLTVYCGFDPTAPSLHVGNLVGLLSLRRLQLSGHRPIVLAGGATGMIGDPSGRQSERSLLSDDELASNLEGIVPQLKKFLDFGEGSCQAKLLDNRAWTVGAGILDFLRDVGKHVTIQQMTSKESVKNRMGNEQGLSYTEFSYMLLQAYDYLWLAQNENCELQIGGSDQWGNITLGIDLIRKKLATMAHALTWPLVTGKDGSKIGKTQSGQNLWLDADMTSPYKFYQAWMNVPDSDLRSLLGRLTFMDTGEIDDIVNSHSKNPSARKGQKRLASEVTTIVHGPESTKTARSASDVLFGATPPESASGTALALVASEIPNSKLHNKNTSIVDALVGSNMSPSKGSARKSIAEGSVYLNGNRVTDDDRLISSNDLLAGRYVLLRIGKRSWHMLDAA